MGSQWINDLNGKNAEEIERRVMDAMRRTFRPEFLNRIDEIITFNSLGPEEIEKIVGIQMTLLRKRLEDNKINLKLLDKAREFLAKTGFDPVYGARPLKRTIQRYIQDPLAMRILDGSINEGSQVAVDVKDGEVVFKTM